MALESTEQIFGWAADKYLVDDEFTWIVDFDDIAPFCEFPDAKAGDHAGRAEGPGQLAAEHGQRLQPTFGY